MSEFKPWQEEVFISVDLETSGKYPLTAEICEMAAVKWQGGKVIDEFSCLIKPQLPMGEEVIKIHHITNEMVKDAPRIGNKIRELYDFVKDGYFVAHHAPFDMGFLANEFELAGLRLPKLPAFCTSIFSIKAIPETKNHKLATLVDFLKLNREQAHRALDDAKACLEVMLECFKRAGAGKTMGVHELLRYQEVKLEWNIFSIAQLNGDAVMGKIIKATRLKEPLQIVYLGGSQPNQIRTIYPAGLVRNVMGDYIVAKDHPDDKVTKKFYRSKIKSSTF